jgi:FAD/FMN-containing dehydrogenase
VTVLVECAGHGDQVDALAAAVAGLDGVGATVVAADGPRRAALWRHREALTEAVSGVGPPHKLDVTLPAAALAAFAEEVPATVAAAAPGARTWLFGHLGDGNLHVNVTGLAPDDPAADDAVLALVLAHRGSISAEHGVGTAKRAWLARQRGDAAVAAMRAVKAALDPAGVLNPHVLL